MLKEHLLNNGKYSQNCKYKFILWWISIFLFIIIIIIIFQLSLYLVLTFCILNFSILWISWTTRVKKVNRKRRVCQISVTSAQVPQKCPMKAWVPWMFECPMSIYKCALRCQISDQIQLNEANYLRMDQVKFVEEWYCLPKGVITWSRFAGMKFCPALPGFRQYSKLFINFILWLHGKSFIPARWDLAFVLPGRNFPM